MVYIKTIGCMRKIAANDAITLRVRSSHTVCDEDKIAVAKRKAMNEAKGKWPESEGHEAHFVVFSSPITKREMLDLAWDCVLMENAT